MAHVSVEARKPRGLASLNTATGDMTMAKTTKTAAKKNGAKRDPNLVPLKDAMAKPTATKRTTKAKASTPANEKKLSCLDAAAQVLKSSGKPMNCIGMVEAMKEKKLWTSAAPTPAATLYSAILREMQTKKSDARFKKVDRGQFTLNAKGA